MYLAKRAGYKRVSSCVRAITRHVWMSVEVLRPLEYAGQVEAVCATNKEIVKGDSMIIG